MMYCSTVAKYSRSDKYAEHSVREVVDWLDVLTQQLRVHVV